MSNYLIQVWLAANCVGRQIGAVIVPPNTCTEPAFGLAFKTNGTWLTVANNCSQTMYLNTVRCNADEGCCYIPQGLSGNITRTDDTVYVAPQLEGLPEPVNGRRFVCTEEPF